MKKGFTSILYSFIVILTSNQQFLRLMREIVLRANGPMGVSQ